VKKLSLLLVLLTSIITAQANWATMTIYKDGIALIKQPVSWEAEEGKQIISFDQLPPQIIEDSPFLILKGAKVQLQRFNDDVFSSNKFLRKNLGETINVNFLDGKSESGELIEYSGSRISIRKRKKVTQIPMKSIMYITLTGETIDEKLRPALEWTVDIKNETVLTGSLVYLSGGFKWNAVYRMIVNENSKKATFIPEAFVSNSSTLDYENIKMSLVEGTLNKDRTSQKASSGPKMVAERMSIRDAGVSTTASNEKLGDFYIYDLPGTFNFNSEEGMTVRLYNPRDISYEKTYLFENAERAQHEEPMEVGLKFSNTKENGLDMPLPAGKISLYTTRSNGILEYIGEDHLDQIPRGQNVNVVAGHAFDVIGKRKVLNFDRQQKSEEAVIQIQIVNTRNEKINTRIIEHIYGDWVIRDASINYIKSDASTIYFPVTVDANSETYVTYTYRKEWK